MQLATENEAESGCKFIANERVVDPRGAGNLSKDPQTIDLEPCLRVPCILHLTASAHGCRDGIDRFIST